MEPRRRQHLELWIDRSVSGTVTGSGVGGDSHPPLRADAPVFGPAEGLPLPIRSPTGGVLVFPGSEGSTLASGVSTRGSAVTTVISAASAPRSSVIAPSPLASGTSPAMSAATSSVTVSVPSTMTGTPRSVRSTLVDEATVRPSVTTSIGTSLYNACTYDRCVANPS